MRCRRHLMIPFLRSIVCIQHTTKRCSRTMTKVAHLSYPELPSFSLIGFQRG